MRKILTCLMLLSLITVSACTQHTQYGECVGIGDTKQDHLQYEVSYWNTFLAFIFFETVIVPVVTVASDISCPVGTK